MGFMGCFWALTAAIGSPDVRCRVLWDESDRLMASSDPLAPIRAQKHPKIDPYLRFPSVDPYLLFPSKVLGG